jgi:hypothetical protein
MNYMAGAVGLTVDFTEGKQQPAFGPLQYWDATSGTIWFYWAKYGRLVGFDLLTRHLVGSLGPDGFAAGVPKTGARFNGASQRTLYTRATVYQADLGTRTLKPLFVTTKDDPVGATSDVLENGGFSYTVVLTRHWVQLIMADGTTTWRLPFEQPRSDYTDVKVVTLMPRGNLRCWSVHQPKLTTKIRGNCLLTSLGSTPARMLSNVAVMTL